MKVKKRKRFPSPGYTAKVMFWSLYPKSHLRDPGLARESRLHKRLPSAKFAEGQKKGSQTLGRRNGWDEGRNRHGFPKPPYWYPNIAQSSCVYLGVKQITMPNSQSKPSIRVKLDQQNQVQIQTLPLRDSKPRPETTNPNQTEGIQMENEVKVPNPQSARITSKAWPCSVPGLKPFWPPREGQIQPGIR